MAFKGSTEELGLNDSNTVWNSPIEVSLDSDGLNDSLAEMDFCAGSVTEELGLRVSVVLLAIAIMPLVDALVLKDSVALLKRAIT
jgi:hypothetical protein